MSKTRSSSPMSKLHDKELDDDALLNETVYSIQDKMTLVTIQKLISVFVFLIALTILIASTLVYIKINIRETVLFVIIISALALVLSILSIIWCFQIRNINAFKKIGITVFILSVALQICFLVALLGNVLWRTFELDSKRAALSSQTEAKAFNQILDSHAYFLNSSLIAFAALSLILQILLSFTSFTAYICSNDKYSLRKFIHFINISLCLLGFLALIFIGVCSDYHLTIRALLKSFNRSFLTSAGFGIGTGAIFLSLVVSIFNMIRNRNTYFIAGALLLFFSTIAMSHSGLLLRQSLKVRRELITSCPQQLRVTHKSDLEAYGCHSKYIEASGKPVSRLCPSDQKAEVWEPDVSKNLVERARAIGCLNFRCCEANSTLKLIWFFRAGLITFSLSVIAFVLSATCLFLSFKSFLKSGQTNYKIDYIFLILFCLLFIVGLVVFFSFHSRVPAERTLLLAETEVETPFKRENDFYFAENRKPMLYEDLDKKFCYSVNTLIEHKKLNHFLSPSCPHGNICNQNTVRLGLKMEQGDFEIKESFNDPKVKRYGKSHLSTFFPEYGRKDDFIAIEGPFGFVKGMLSEELKYCPDVDALRPKINIVYEYLFRDPNPLKKKPASQITQNIRNVTKPKSKTVGAHAVANNSVPLGSENKKPANTKAHRQGNNQQQRIVDQLYFWRDLDIVVVDQSTGDKIPAAWVKIYPGHELCDENLDSKHEHIAGVTASNGSFKAYNLIRKVHTIVSGSGGHKINCEAVDLQSFKYDEFYLALTPEVAGENSLKAVLYWSEPNLNLQLLTRFEHNQNEECRVGFFNPDCGGTLLETSAIKNYSMFNLTQAISIKRLGHYVYAFSVVDDSPSRSLVSNSSLGAEALNGPFDSANAVVKVYVRESLYPVAEYFKPAMSAEELGKSGLHWMVFCLNGRVGFPNQKQVGIFLEEKVGKVSLRFGDNECKKYLEAK